MAPWKCHGVALAGARLMLTALAVVTLLAATWRLATPLLYAALGGLFTERAGILNIGLEGMMLLGAFSGFVAATWTGQASWGLLAAVLSGVLSGLLFALFTVTLRANAIIVGTALNMVASGLTGFLFRAWFGAWLAVPAYAAFAPLALPGLSRWPLLGPIFFQHNGLVYIAVLLVPLAGYVLYRTSFGLALRAVGEYPPAAHTAGVSVAGVRYAAILLSGVLAALGGAYLSLAYSNQCVEEMTSGRGFIALAVVILGRRAPGGVLGAALLFGLCYALQLRLQSEANQYVPYQIMQALPYVMTIAALLLWRRGVASPPPLAHAALDEISAA